MLSSKQQFFKRVFDVLIALVGLLLSFLLLLIFFLITSISTKSFGLFSQRRVGRFGKFFNMYKIKTMREFKDGRIFVTSFGKLLRKSKLDELPQLYNVLLGDMSLVGPRPDIAGYADKLVGEDRIILSVRPGITGPATLKFSNEEELLFNQECPLKYNNEVIWPQKVELNKRYIHEWNFINDLRYIWRTLIQLIH